MNIVKQLNAFNRMQIQDPLTTGQLALWYALLDVNNACGWKEWFDVAMLRLELFTGMSRQGIDKARKVLKEKGFIDYQANEREATSYRLICLYEETTFQESMSLPHEIAPSAQSIVLPQQKEIVSSPEVQQRTTPNSKEELPVLVQKPTGCKRVTNQEHCSSPLYKLNESKHNQKKQNNSSQQISVEQEEWQSVLAYYKEQQLPSLSDAQKKIGNAT